MKRKSLLCMMLLCVMMCFSACKNGGEPIEGMFKTSPPKVTTQPEENKEVKETQPSASAKAQTDENKKGNEEAGMYKVRASFGVAATQLGAFESLENAKKLCDSKPGYRVYDNKGQIVYSGILEKLSDNQALLFYPDAELTKLLTETVTLKKDGIDGLIEALISKKVLSENSKAIAFKIDKKSRSATLDMSKEYYDLLNSYGTSGEMYATGSLCNTVLTYFELDTIKVTYDSKTIETGHCIYDEPMYFSKY